jgi:hypothetical protein
MKPKLIFCLALILSGGFATQRACGFEAEIQINHSNLKTYCPFIKIKTVRPNITNNPVVFFTVIVVPKDKLQQSEHFEGNLEINDTSIKDSHNVICWTSVEARKLISATITDEIPKPLRVKCIAFEFGVAIKYLETSDFRVEETNGELDGAPVDYIFNLKEFADEK